MNKTKAERMAEAARRDEEAAEKDSLTVVLEDATSAAVAIRGMRDSTTRELQRIISDDVLGALIVMGQDLAERDYDHDLRIQRVELALGLDPIDPETDEEEAILSGAWSMSDDESGDESEDESETVEPSAQMTAQMRLGAELANVPMPVIREGLGSIRKLMSIVAECSTPTEEDQAMAGQVLGLLDFVASMVPDAAAEDGEEPIMGEIVSEGAASEVES